MILLPFAAKCSGIYCHSTSATEYPFNNFFFKPQQTSEP